MLLTARPDLLPIDLKRQGRAEVHIPLFYPTDENEIRQMFVILAKKLGIAAVARTTCRRFRSAVICRARTSRGWSAGPGASRCWPAQDHITREALAEVVGAVHAVHAGPRARAAGNSGHRRVHGSAVPAA